METDDKLKEILKTMVSFHVETHLEDDEAKEELVNYFKEILNSDDDLIKSFLPKLFDAMTNILIDMNIMEPIESEEGEDGELSDLGEPESGMSNESFKRKLRLMSDRANDFLM